VWKVALSLEKEATYSFESGMLYFLFLGRLDMHHPIHFEQMFIHM
jgi:hypothetical protein